MNPKFGMPPHPSTVYPTLLPTPLPHPGFGIVLTKIDYFTCQWYITPCFSPSKWRHSTLNKDFQHIDTYPEDLVVPASVPDEVIRKSSYFRSIGN